MRLLFINRVFPPAGGATGDILSELAEYLSHQGFEVIVLTGPADEAPASEVLANGVRVERVNALAFTRKNTIRRAAAYLSLYPLFLKRALSLPAPDVVITKTDPPLQLILGPLIKWWTGARSVHWAQDIYPEIAEELGVVPRKGMLANVLRSLSTRWLRGHDRIAAVGRCMKDRIVQRGVPSKNVHVIPNWAPQQISSVHHDENPFRVQHKLDDRFVVMYSGNMGLAHPFEPMLDAADLLRTSDPDVLFLFVGEGPRLAELKEQVDVRQLDNVRFLPFQPKEQLDESLSAADLHLASMHEHVCGLVVPSKIYGILAAGRPCLFLGPPESEVSCVLAEHKCGHVMGGMPRGEDLAERILYWKKHPEERGAAGERALQVAEETRRGSLEAFELLIEELG